MNAVDVERMGAEGKITTAVARRLARDAEAAMDWARAAALYDYAADVYPQPYPKSGALRDRDVAALRQAAKDCRAMVQP